LYQKVNFYLIQSESSLTVQNFRQFTVTNLLFISVRLMVTMVLTRLEVYIGPLWPTRYSATGRIHQLVYCCTNHKWHKQGATKLLKLL